MSQISNNRISPSALASYSHPQAGNTERYLSLQPLSEAGPTLSSYQALKDYVIRDFGVGFPAAEAILAHIVRNKLGNSGQMPPDFWNRLVVLPVKCALRSTQTGQTFEASTANSVAGISHEFAASEGPLRVREVEDYASQMQNGADLGVPLYVTGAVLNLVGGNAHAQSIYMMDGARRITAAALNRRREVTIWLLLVEDEYARLLQPVSIAGLRQHLAALRWFSNYQSIPLAGLQGERSLNRFGLMDLSLLRDQVVMDFGCNTGQSCLKAVQAGAREVIGIEGMRDTWEGAVQIGRLAGFQNLRYLNVNFNSPDFDAAINQQSPERADYSFFFSVYRTKELVQRDRLFQYIIDKTRKGIFFEGHAHSKIDTLEYYDWLFDSFGLNHQFLGNSEGELRPLFFLDLAQAKRKESSSSSSGAVVASLSKPPETLPRQTAAQPIPRLLNRSVPSWQSVTGSTANTAKREPTLTPQPDRYRVSAIVSTYKNERFIGGRLNDLLAQTLGEQLEIIVVDSGSLENEGAIVRRFQKKHRNIRYIRTEQRENVYQAWNRGVRAASGKYLTNANTDDRLRPDALEVLARELDQNPSIALVYADFWITGLENQDFGSHICTGYSLKPDYHPNIMLAGCHIGPQPMWRRSVHNEIGYFDESFFASGDYEFWCRLALRHPMKHVREFLGLYLHNGVGVSNSNLQRSWAEAQRVQDMYRQHFPAPAGDLPTGFYFRDAIRPGGYVNIGMVTFNRLEFTKQAIDAVARFTNFPYALTVVDNCSQDGTQDTLKELKRRGVIKNLVLLNENIGVARASNVAWQQEPEAGYYLKLDNDIVVQKSDWLNRMVQTVDVVPELAALAYNFEPVSYPLEILHGCRIRPKRHANLGGACYLIPKRGHEALGYWCEDYGLYGEEDHDHSVRLRLAGFLNAYMEDEEIGIHLPGGKAGKIDPISHQTTDASEQQLHFDYRAWKDQLRHQLKASGGVFERNHGCYAQGLRSLYMPRGVFLGKIGDTIQVFDQQDSLSFLTLSGSMQPGHRTEILRWLQAESITASAVEVVSENGKEFLQVRKQERHQSPQQRALQLCRDGEQFLQDGNYEQALARFDNATRMEKNIQGVEYARAVCLERLRRYTEAETALLGELKLQPEHADGLDLLKKVKHYRRIQLANEKRRKSHAARIRVAVLSFDEVHTNCAGLRLLEPLLRLPEIELTWAVHIANQRGMFDMEAIKHADLFVMQRMFPRPDTETALTGILKMGTPIIYEVDDLLMEMPTNNPNRDFAMQCCPFVLDVMQKAAAITVSTEALKAELLRWNSNIYVLPNLIDERLWSQTQQTHAGPVVIGFTGTSTHGDDLRMIEDAFIQISAKHGRGVAFQFMGCVTDRLARLPGAKVVEFTPDYESFARELQTTPMDVAVVSLEDNLFNRCKSNIKWLEYSACGIAGVYSDLPPYNSCIRHGQTGLLVGNRVHDWFQGIDTLVTNASLRRAISQQARQEVLSDYTLASPKVRRYAEAYHAILGRPLQSSSVSSVVKPATFATPVCQIRGIDLEQAVAQEPHLQSVVERVNRALSLGRTQMATRMVQKELGHRAEAAKVVALLEDEQLTAVS
jgi:glycosyltransferase involved in cell wall biosynthesis/SAM-dependent methyltransferase